MSAIMTLVDGYSRIKNPSSARYRSMTIAEAKLLRAGERIPFLCQDGTCRDLTINGRPKVWKTRPGHVKVPIKYGRYEYGYAEAYTENVHDDVSLLLVAMGND